MEQSPDKLGLIAKSPSSLKLFFMRVAVQRQFNIEESYELLMGYALEDVVNVMKNRFVAVPFEAKVLIEVELSEVLKMVDLPVQSKEASPVVSLPLVPQMAKEQFVNNVHLIADRFASKEDAETLRTILQRIK